MIDLWQIIDALNNTQFNEIIIVLRITGSVILVALYICIVIKLLEE